MRLDNNKSKVKPEESEVTRQAKKQTEYKKVGDHTKAIDGGKIWKVSKENMSVEPARYRTSDTIHWWDVIRNTIPPDKIDVEKGLLVCRSRQ